MGKRTVFKQLHLCTQKKKKTLWLYTYVIVCVAHIYCASMQIGEGDHKFRQQPTAGMLWCAQAELSVYYEACISSPCWLPLK